MESYAGDIPQATKRPKTIKDFKVALQLVLEDWMTLGIGHIMRGDGLMKEVMEGKMKGKRGQGRKRIGMIDQLMENKQYRDLKRKAEDRQGWRVWLPGTCHVAEH